MAEQCPTFLETQHLRHKVCRIFFLHGHDSNGSGENSVSVRSESPLAEHVQG